VADLASHSEKLVHCVLPDRTVEMLPSDLSNEDKKTF
jgi:hypothetical protein